MDVTRGALLGLAIVLLASCGRDEAADSIANSGLTSWASVLADDINVPTGVAYTQGTVDGMTVAQISGVPEQAPSTGTTGGVSIRLPAAFESQASNARVQVTVRAFAPEDGVLLGVAYSTADVGNSGWQRFVLTTEPRDYVFAYDVEPMRAGRGDFVGFRSYGAGTVQIVGYKVEIVPPPAGAPAPPRAAPPASP